MKICVDENEKWSWRENGYREEEICPSQTKKIRLLLYRDIQKERENTQTFAFSLICECKVEAHTENVLSDLAHLCVINHQHHH